MQKGNALCGLPLSHPEDRTAKTTAGILALGG